MKQIIHMVLNLSPQTGWNLSECEPIITNLMKRCQKHGVQLQVTMCREGEEPVVFDTSAADTSTPDISAPDTTASETTASDTVRQELPSSQTICMDLTDARLYRSPASVLFALIIRLKMSDCDVPVDFGGDDVFGVHIHGFYLTTLPRHHLMLRDPYARKHVEDYEAADRQILECRRLIRDGIRKFSDEEFRKEINLPIKVRKREAPFIKVLDHAFLQLILFVEKLSADKMLTETMRAALGKLADGAYEEALKMLADGSCEDSSNEAMDGSCEGSSNEAMDGAGSGGLSLYLRTPDELMLRYLILQTHAMEPGTWQDACLALEKAAGREAEQISDRSAVSSVSDRSAVSYSSDSSALSSGSALTEYLRRQMIRQDYARAVAAADQCLLHPRLKASVEVLLLKGSALSAMRRFPDADLTLKKAIRICQEKAKGRPVTVLPVLVLCMCEQAKALAGDRKSKAAQKVLQQAQDILVNKTPGQELVGLVFSGKAERRDFYYDRIGFCSCIAAARLLQEKSRFPEQKEQYEEAVELLEKSSVFMREANCGYPDPMGVSVRADIMNMKGYIQWENDDGYAAGQEFSGAKAMIERLRVFMPDAWPVLLADICNNRGIKLTDNPYHYNDAKQEYLFAAKLLTEEAPDSPSATEMLGDCYYDLGLLYSEWGKKNKAEEYYKKARKEYLIVGKNAMKEKLDLLAKDRREN